jgi:2-keto-3-deoxy-L-rhamnonate aldolase RhmA
MPLTLMYITNKPEIALIAEKSGVDWIFIDLEIIGKEERQGHLDTVISKHSISDIKPIKDVLTKSKLLVRVNPIHENSEKEINEVISNGADIVMLPYFKTKKEVENFISFVNNRVKTCLLLETPEAVDILDDILEVKGINYIHIGLNDLHLGYKMKFMFELLADGTVEMLCKKIKNKNIKYGFGGIAQLGQGLLPAEYIITEHYRLGSTMAILSRSFCNIKEKNRESDISEVFSEGIKKISDYENKLLYETLEYFNKNKEEVNKLVLKITKETILIERD